MNAYASPEKKLLKRLVANWHYYLLMLPGLALLILFRYVPMGGLVVAFKDYRFNTGIWGSSWTGFEWFAQLFTNKQFSQVLNNTLYISFLKLCIGFPFTIMLSIMLSEVQYRRLKRTIQTVVYLPHFISWVVIGSILTTILSPSMGISSYFGATINPLLRTDSFRLWVVLTDIWKESGWGTVVYLAAISGISADLYEAATVDGAGRFQRIWHITIPGMMGTIAVMLILRTGSILNAGFDQIYVLQTPTTMDVGDVLDTFVYRYGIGKGRFAYGAAAGMFQSVVGLILVTVTNYITKRMNQPSIW